MSADPKRILAVRIKTGAHAGDIREMPEEVAMELVPLGRVQLVPWEDYVRTRMLGRLVALGLRDQPPEIQIANQESVAPSKSSLRRIVGI